MVGIDQEVHAEESTQDLEIKVKPQGPSWDKLEISSTSGGLLVRNQIYDRGWKVWVNGAPRKLLRANLAFQAVPIPPGKVQVEFRFLPDYFGWGLWIHGLGWLLVILGILGGRKRILGAG